MRWLCVCVCMWSSSHTHACSRNNYYKRPLALAHARSCACDNNDDDVSASERTAVLCQFQAIAHPRHQPTAAAARSPASPPAIITSTTACGTLYRLYNMQRVSRAHVHSLPLHTCDKRAFLMESINWGAPRSRVCARPLPLLRHACIIYSYTGVHGPAASAAACCVRAWPHFA